MGEDYIVVFGVGTFISAHGNGKRNSYEMDWIGSGSNLVEKDIKKAKNYSEMDKVDVCLSKAYIT